MRGSSILKLLVASMLLAGRPADANVNGTITQLTTGTATESQSAPAVSVANVVWTDATATDVDIYLLDLNSGTPRNLTQTPDEREYLEDIDGLNVVWTRKATGHPGDIVLYDTVTNTWAAIASSVDDPNNVLYFEQPSISGPYVVFMRLMGSQWDVRAYDHVGDVPIPSDGSGITNDAALQNRPRVGGDFIVYEDYNSGNADIMGYQISTQTHFTIATGSADQITPDVSGTTAVWVQSGSADQLFVRDLPSGATTQITSANSKKVSPRISGSRIVWSDDRNGNFDLYAYDLKTHTEEPMVTTSGDQTLSDIDGDRVVYTSNENGFQSIFLFTYASPPPPPPPPDLPPECDPARTELVDGPVTLTRTTRRPSFGSGAYTSTAGKSYTLCVENGLPNGTQRTAQALLTVDGHVVLSPANFKPNANPPHYVAAPLLDKSRTATSHAWTAALYGTQIPTTITVTIRAR